MPLTSFTPAHPDCLRNRNGERVTFLIIHTMEGSLAGTRAWFAMGKVQRAGANLRARGIRNPTPEALAAQAAHVVPTAAHYLFGRDGEIVQMVPDDRSCLHAGNNTYNRRSIGFEHEGHAGRGGFSDAMLRVSARCAAVLCAKYDIPADRAHILGHGEVPGATHTDPGEHWPWEVYMGMVREEMRARGAA